MRIEFFAPMLPPTTQWKKIPGYGGKYGISSAGGVRNRKTGRLLKIITRKKDGYLSVHLSDGKKASTVMTHRLVAEAFVPNPRNLPVVNHIDGNKSNPKVGNLEWVSFSENSKHAFRTGLSHISEKCKEAVSKIAAENGAKTTSVSVAQVKNGVVVQIFPSIREAARVTGIARASISRACKESAYSAGGSKWQIE